MSGRIDQISNLRTALPLQPAVVSLVALNEAAEPVAAEAAIKTLADNKAT